MSDFLQLAQSLAVALKALQMYTASHPRCPGVPCHRPCDARSAGWRSRTGSSSSSREPRPSSTARCRTPGESHISALARLVSDRGISGFIFERGLTADELLAFLQGLATKPAKLEEQGGFESPAQSAGVRHIKVSQTRYQEVTEGEESGSGDKAPALSPAPPPSPSPENLVNFIREALLSTLAKSCRCLHGQDSQGFHLRVQWRRGERLSGRHVR